MALVRAYRDKVPQIAEDVFLAETATIIGDVVIEAGASVWYGAVLRGDVGPIRIGRGTNIQDLACIHMTGGQTEAVLGANVTVGHGAIIHGATIGDGALIGMGAIVLDGASVGARAIVAAGAVVSPRTVVPEGVLVRGTPAKVARALEPEEQEAGAKTARTYQELAVSYGVRRAAVALPVER